MGGAVTGMRRVVINGLGIAGSYLAWSLALENVDVEGYDILREYRKPCGDAVTLRPWIRRLLEEFDVVKTAVKNYIVKVSGEEASNISYRAPNWYMIDKTRLVQTLRKDASKNGARLHWKKSGVCSEDAICVDARGPFAHPKKTWVLAYRIIGRAENRFDPETAVLDFYPEIGGLFWLFPLDDKGSLYNFGSGFLGEYDAKRLHAFSLEHARKYVGKVEVLDTRASPIAVLSPVRLASESNTIYVGERAGLVLSSAGEGNRPALESSRALAETITSGSDDLVRSYRRRIDGLVSEVLASRIALRLTVKMPWLFKRGVARLGEEFWRDYLSSRLTMERALKWMIKLPLVL